MEIFADIVLQKRLQRLSKYFAVIVLLIAALVLAGWQWDIDILKRPIPQLVAMNPISALCFILAGVSFLLLKSIHPSPKKSMLAYVLASLVLFVGTIKIIELITNFDWQIDHILYTKKIVSDIKGNLSNSMAPNTAFCFMLLGICLFLSNTQNDKKQKLVQVLALLIMFIALLSVIAYLYRVTALYGMLTYIPMAIQTAICFLLLSVSILFIDPGKGLIKEFTSTFSGSVATRSLFPLSIIVPILLGFVFLRLYGHRGGVFTIEFGAAILVLCMIIVFIAITWYNTISLNRRDELKKKTEDALKESEQRFRLLVSNIKDYAIFMIDKDGYIISWNEGAQYIKGYSSKEIIGKHISVFYTAEELAKNEPALNLKMAEENGSVECEGWRVRKDGSRFRANVVFTAIYDEGQRLQGFAKVTRDITERKEMEEQLRKFNDKLEKQVSMKTAELTGIFERITDAFIALDKNFCYTYLNKKAGELIHHKPESLIGKNVWDVFPDAVGSATYEAFNKAMAEQQHIINIDHYEPLELWQENHIYPSPDGLSIFIRDISEKKKSDEALKYSEETRRLIMNSALDAIVCIDAKGIITVWNPQAERIFGWDENEVMGKSLAETIIPTQYREAHAKGLQHYLATGEERVLNKMIELTALQKNGKQFPIELAIVPIKQQGNEIFCAFIRDITERKKSAERLSQERNLLRTLIDNLPDYIYVKDMNLRHLINNVANVKLIGAGSEEETLGKTVLDYFQHDLALKYIQDDMKILQTKNPMINNEELVATKDGSQRWLLTTKLPLKDKNNNTIGLVGISRDITEQKEAEQRLRLSEKKYKLLFESNPMPMWMLSLSDHSFIDVNEAALKHYGYTRKEFLALNATEIRPKEEQERYLDESKRHIPGLSYRGTWPHKKRDGSIIYVDIHANDLVYEGKQVRLVLANDVSEKLSAESNLKKSYSDIRELASHLQDIREEERAGIAREIHDELGQQLTGLKMDMYWLAKRVNLYENGQVGVKLNNTIALLDKTIKTVRRISTELHPSILDDLGLIAAIEWYSQEFAKRSDLHIDFQTGIREFTFPPTMSIALFRICQESLTNIARHANAKNVSISLEPNENKIILTITDDGKGFDINKKTGKKSLGLIGMRERALMMNGEFEISSEPGKGTSLVVKIPWSQSTTQ